MRLIPRLIPLLALPALIVGTALMTASPASAAVVTGAIKTVSVTDSAGGTTPAQGSQLTTNITWCVPDGSRAGDTFSLTLDDHLRRLPAGFTLDDPATGTPVATAAISNDSPWIATFTLMSYAETHTGVCGTAFVRSDFDGVSTPTNTTTPFTETTNDGKVFTTDITPTGPVPFDATQPSKYGTWTNADQGQVDPTDFITWHIDTPDGAFDSATTVDAVPAGELWHFDCDTVRLSNGAIDANGDYQPLAGTAGDVTDAVPFDCSDTQVTVQWPAEQAGDRYRLEVAASLDAPVGSDSDPARFTNDATVTTTVGATVSQFSTSAALVQASGGGDGSGSAITPPPAVTPTPTPAPSTTPTPAPTATIAPAASTGTPAAARVVRANGADELAMTGQDDTPGIAIGGGLLVLGLVLTLAAKRRRNATR
ncbi:Ig-like domain-containing protein [Curtobacterium sp. RRHDQ10]|uniref:Ig-like domain-containing protein n=1 Tax=Curtobacterium phyllosphaerae TaxID=3413379 RepID=UPI003BF1E7FC